MKSPICDTEIFRHGPIVIYTRLPAGGTYYPICAFSASSECLIGISDAFSAFVYGCPSSSPRAHCTPNKSVPTLRYTRRHGPIHTGSCPKALTECSPLDFRRSSITATTPHCYKKSSGGGSTEIPETGGETGGEGTGPRLSSPCL